ncbi:hypothetical protein LCGC14_0768140 [marine sediment metagenome]|uniref:Metallo-beta-lactamase domain-containing protein n=1 Tax=marine sediment metagenome TaxID=412755 RepID=A0A0F9QIY0_9ZZZZ
MNIINVASNLYDIQLDLKGTNFTSTLSSWAYKDDNLCFLVDTGPKSAINSLKHALDKIGIKENDLNYILLTHIHLDHAGGVGELIKFFPQAQVICHPKGIKHLINPERLWEGSLKVLGDVARAYGKMMPVPEDRIEFQKFIYDGKIKIIETAGHAPHHQSYIFDRYLFSGEAAGVNIPLEGSIYSRPATPPTFNYEVWASSISRLLNENLKGYKMCYAHFGMKENAIELLKIAELQLVTWIRVIEELSEKRHEPNYLEIVKKTLKMKDKYFATLDSLDKNMREKELYFVGNSVRGITEYIHREKLDNKN